MGNLPGGIFREFGEEVVAKELKAFKNLLYSNGIKFFLIGGLCLGLIRERKFLEHDKDIDIGIFEDVDLERLKTILEAHYDEVSISGGVENGGKIVWAKKPINGKLLVFEIQVHYKSGNIIYMNRDLGASTPKGWRKGRMQWDYKYFANLQSVRLALDGEEYLVPSPPEEYLTVQHGNWKVPEEYTDWRYHVKNLFEGWINPDVVAIILAGGEGKRFGDMKQFVLIHGKSVLAHTVEKFFGLAKIIIVPEPVFPDAVLIAKKNKFENFSLVVGGSTRQESARIALQYAHKHCEPRKVIITDADRPLITRGTIQKGLDLLEEYDCVVAGCKTVNTICEFKDSYKVLSRDHMFDLLMPQFFKFKDIYEAHEKTEKKNVTDDSQLLDGKRIKFLEISFWEGLKLTYPGDYEIFELLLGERNVR